ncbi:MAG: small multi-drug export protein, partial [Candidatus Sumerlaeia bacterium]|nr:small multi-drug export protein [Candidatus Sumerlaeia bacterium]
IGDMMNIPFFATLYDLAHKGLRISRRVAGWLDRARGHLESRGFYRRFAAMGAWGVVLIAAIPMWGCGMWSAILLAWTLRMSRLSGILYLSLGSWIGSLLVLGVALGLLRVFGVA